MIAQSDELLLQALAERLGAEPDLRVATVFGSVASGSAGFDSDVDVAVMRAALCEGRVLVGRHRRDYDFLLSKMVTDAEDFLPGLQRMQAERRKAWIR